MTTLDDVVNDVMRFSDVVPMFNATPTVTPSNQQPLPLDDKQARLVGKSAASSTHIGLYCYIQWYTV